MTVSQLLALLAITKQSLGRVLTELGERGLVETRPGDRDRRQRLLRLTEAGKALENELFEALRERLSAAYASAGQSAVSGFWQCSRGSSLKMSAPGSKACGTNRSPYRSKRLQIFQQGELVRLGQGSCRIHARSGCCLNCAGHIRW